MPCSWPSWWPTAVEASRCQLRLAPSGHGKQRGIQKPGWPAIFVFMKISRKGAKRSIQGVLALSLALCSNAALALGLGDIRVISKPGQPLVAEIPVISSDPGELENARVGLASPATFERVGLALPDSTVTQLQFVIAQDARGRAVIRVTSPHIVEVPVLSFLIEVDWGNGRLVREYSALVDAPMQATAVAEPVIEAPQAAPQNMIVREPEVLTADQPRPLPLEAAPAAPAAAPVAAAPVQQAQTPAPAPSASNGADPVTVRQGQTASHIARDLARQSGHSLNQTMVALLQANPEAFIKNNVNLLKQGAVLRMPRNDEMAQMDAVEAAAVIQAQTAQWRQARAPVPQPAGEPLAPAATVAATGNSAAAQARLEIAPALATDGKNAGSTSGLDAQGEGDMLAKEQLQQAQEELASRDAELSELRNRVAELEKLKEQQQSLIAMKDTDLAAAQKRLAEAPRAEGAAVDNSPLWMGLGGGLAIVMGLVWWLSRRRKPSPLPPLAASTASGQGEPVWPGVNAPAFDPAPSDGLPEEVSAEAEPAVQPAVEDAVADERSHAPAFELERAPARESTLPPLPVKTDDMLWYTPEPRVAADEQASSPADELAHALERFEQRVEPEILPTTEQREFAERNHDADASIAAPNAEQDVASAVSPARPWQMDELPPMRPLHPAPAVRERLELAIAYMDLGDAGTARTLLREVADSDDEQARREAVELLERLR